jgi:hypothetical protein
MRAIIDLETASTLAEAYEARVVRNESEEDIAELMDPTLAPIERKQLALAYSEIDLFSYTSDIFAGAPYQDPFYKALQTAQDQEMAAFLRIETDANVIHKLVLEAELANEITTTSNYRSRIDVAEVLKVFGLPNRQKKVERSMTARDPEAVIHALGETRTKISGALTRRPPFTPEHQALVDSLKDLQEKLANPGGVTSKEILAVFRSEPRSAAAEVKISKEGPDGLLLALSTISGRLDSAQKRHDYSVSRKQVVSDDDLAALETLKNLEGRLRQNHEANAKNLKIVDRYGQAYIANAVLYQDKRAELRDGKFLSEVRTNWEAKRVMVLRAHLLRTLKSAAVDVSKREDLDLIGGSIPANLDLTKVMGAATMDRSILNAQRKAVGATTAQSAGRSQTATMLADGTAAMIIAREAKGLDGDESHMNIRYITPIERLESLAATRGTIAAESIGESASLAIARERLIDTLPLMKGQAAVWEVGPVNRQGDPTLMWKTAVGTYVLDPYEKDKFSGDGAATHALRLVSPSRMIPITGERHDAWLDEGNGVSFINVANGSEHGSQTAIEDARTRALDLVRTRWNNDWYILDQVGRQADAFGNDQYLPTCINEFEKALTLKEAPTDRPALQSTTRSAGPEDLDAFFETSKTDGRKSLSDFRSEDPVVRSLALSRQITSVEKFIELRRYGHMSYDGDDKHVLEFLSVAQDAASYRGDSDVATAANLFLEMQPRNTGTAGKSIGVTGDDDYKGFDESYLDGDDMKNTKPGYVEAQQILADPMSPGDAAIWMRSYVGGSMEAREKGSVMTPTVYQALPEHARKDSLDKTIFAEFKPDDETRFTVNYVQANGESVTHYEGTGVDPASLAMSPAGAALAKATAGGIIVAPNVDLANMLYDAGMLALAGDRHALPSPQREVMSLQIADGVGPLKGFRSNPQHTAAEHAAAVESHIIDSFLGDIENEQRFRTNAAMLMELAQEKPVRSDDSITSTITQSIAERIYNSTDQGDATMQEYRAEARGVIPRAMLLEKLNNKESFCVRDDGSQVAILTDANHSLMCGIKIGDVRSQDDRKDLLAQLDGLKSAAVTLAWKDDKLTVMESLAKDARAQATCVVARSEFLTQLNTRPENEKVRNPTLTVISTDNVGSIITGRPMNDNSVTIAEISPWQRPALLDQVKAVKSETITLKWANDRLTIVEANDARTQRLALQAAARQNTSLALIARRSKQIAGHTNELGQTRVAAL